MLDVLADNPVLTLFLVVGLGSALGLVPFEPIRFDPAGRCSSGSSPSCLAACSASPAPSRAGPSPGSAPDPGRGRRGGRPGAPSRPSATPSPTRWGGLGIIAVHLGRPRVSRGPLARDAGRRAPGDRRQVDYRRVLLSLAAVGLSSGPALADSLGQPVGRKLLLAGALLAVLGPALLHPPAGDEPGPQRRPDLGLVGNPSLLAFATSRADDERVNKATPPCSPRTRS